MIKVTRTFLPPIEEYLEILSEIWKSGHITNHGKCALELERKLKSYLNVKHIFLVNNGTTALQIAIKAMGLTGEVITTPFSYVATTSSIAWENCTPVFADIDPAGLCIDPSEVEKRITGKTSAILATHVYGNPCDVKRLEQLAKKHNISVIYDAAHAFGVDLNDESILHWGDISTLSFHATKVYHTVEGGALVTNDDETAHRIEYMRNFGHNGPEQFFGIGINGKVSEFHAAMGLVNLKYIDHIFAIRKEIFAIYDKGLEDGGVIRPIQPEGLKYNYSYYPVILASEDLTLKIIDRLNRVNIFPRRYFYPSLNRLPYVKNDNLAPVSEDISRRVLCLPLYAGLDHEDVRKVCTIIKDASSV